MVLRNMSACQAAHAPVKHAEAAHILSCLVVALEGTIHSVFVHGTLAPQGGPAAGYLSIGPAELRRGAAAHEWLMARGTSTPDSTSCKPQFCVPCSRTLHAAANKHPPPPRRRT